MECPRCKFPMKETDRACVNCGMLNTAHPQNAELVEGLTNASANRQFALTHDINLIGDPTIPFYVTYLFLLIACGLITIFIAIADKPMGLLFLLATSIVIYELACFSNLLQKAGSPWWALLVPIANIYFIFKLAFTNAEYILAALIGGGVLVTLTGPVNGMLSMILFFVLTIALVITMVFYNIKLAQKFNANIILTFFFPYIMIPIIAHKYNYRG